MAVSTVDVAHASGGIQPLAAFAWAAFGSAALEIASFIKEIQSKSGLSNARRSKLYWAARISFIFVAGGLGVAFATSVPVAIYIGASAPALLDRLSRVKT